MIWAADLRGRRPLGRLLGLAGGAWHEPGKRLEQERKDDRRQHVRLPEVEGRQPEVGPELAEAETDRGGEKHRKVRAPTVAQRRVEHLRRDEHEQDRHHHARRDEVHRGAPSGPRGWVVLSMLRWVPCLGLSKSRLCAGFWSAVRTPGSRSIGCWATRTLPAAPRERHQCYEGFAGGTTLMCSSSSSAWSTGLGAPSIRS